MRYILLSLLAFTYSGAFAQWSSDASVNNAICNFAGNQMNVQIVSDNAGGAICTWVDTRNGSQDIYAQRIDASGNLQWPVDGIAICTAAADQLSPRLIPDGAGGAIISWIDKRTGDDDIYAQRINAAGTTQWTADGVAICTIAGIQNAQQLISDGAGGAIIVWSDGRVGSPNADIYAQRVDAAGAVLWTAGGAPVCVASSLQNIPQLVSDGAGGAIIAWEDWRNFSQTDIYAQRISSNGFTNWTFNGVVICSEGNFGNQYDTKMISDGAGGAIMCWLDNRNFGSNTDIYIQKVNINGVTQWATNGLAVCNANFIQLSHKMIPDGSGGAIIVWEDRRTDRNIYAQKFNTSGIIQWTANGIPVCNQTSTQEEPQIAAGASGSAIVLWTDYRNGELDIYAQGMNAAGSMSWATGGVPVTNESHAQSTAQLITDGAGGAIIAWQDLRSTVDYDIYSSRLFANGTLPLRFISFSADANKDDVILNWVTDNEVNSSHFDIEFSTDAVSFTKLGEVTAANTGGRNQYEFTHYAPADNILFYRLKQVDIDGRFKYSKTEKVVMDRTLQLLLYPDPASSFIRIKNIKPDDIQSIQVISSDGRTVMTGKAASQLQYDISRLSAGIYILKLVKKDNSVSISRFQKQ